MGGNQPISNPLFEVSDEFFEIASTVFEFGSAVPVGTAYRSNQRHLQHASSVVLEAARLLPVCEQSGARMPQDHASVHMSTRFSISGHNPSEPIWTIWYC